MQQGYVRALDDMKKLDGLVERAELRRDRVLRTFDQSRALRAFVRVRELQLARRVQSDRCADRIGRPETAAR